jgi:hypothetical protein
MNDNDVSRWCDFVRGLLPEGESLRLERQLETGDRRTRGFVEMLRHVAAVGREDAESAVPEHAVRIAKAVGSLRRYGGSAEQARKPTPFSVVFDSLLHGSPAGARDLGPSQRFDRLVSVRAGVYSVDLRLEQEADLRHAVVVGQVVRADESVEPLANVPAILSSAGSVLDSTLTSDLGEFQVRGAAGEDLTLSLLLEDEEWIELPLAEP